jgi:NAD(P)-dependent dehydrogenase (short-subunit alcohol dehydrogenase family)
MQLTQQTFLVTGAASGLGAAVSQELIEQGANVILADVAETAPSKLGAEYAAVARSIRCDVTQPAQIQAALELAAREFGDLHGVIHCAGILHAGKLINKGTLHSVMDFERVLKVNLVGSFNVMMQSAAMMMINKPNANGERGAIVLTSSIAATEGQIGQAAYAASKGGIDAMILPAAREFARYGIRVAAIAPGVMDTELMQVAPSELRESLTQQIPFPPRFGQPREFAALARHIITNCYLNGCTLRLDGGLRMGAK